MYYKNQLSTFSYKELSQGLMLWTESNYLYEHFFQKLPVRLFIEIAWESQNRAWTLQMISSQF